MRALEHNRGRPRCTARRPAELALIAVQREKVEPEQPRYGRCRARVWPGFRARGGWPSLRMAGGSISGVLPSLGDVGATRRHRAHGDQAAKPHPRPRVLARAPAEARADLLYAIVGLEVRSAGCGARADPGPPRL